MSEKSSFRVLIAEVEGVTAKRLSDFLVERGFEAKTVVNGLEAQKELHAWKPHFVIIDMMFKEMSGLQLLEEVQKNKMDTKVFITSSHNNVENVKQALKSGADDYIVKPYKVEDILSRLVFHIQKERKSTAAAEQKSDSSEGTILQLMTFVLKEAVSGKRIHDILWNHTKMLEITLKAVRVSVILCHEDRINGAVMVSSDSRALMGLKIDLNRYPEVIHVMNTEKMVVVENMENDPTMALIKDAAKSISFNAIIVAPLWRHGKFYGVVSARMPKERGSFSDRDIRFAQLLSYVISTVISTDHQNTLSVPKAA